MRGGLAQVDHTSKYENLSLDDEIVNELSIQLNLKKNDLAATLNEWKYDALTGK